MQSSKLRVGPKSRGLFIQSIENSWFNCFAKLYGEAMRLVVTFGLCKAEAGSICSHQQSMHADIPTGYCWVDPTLCLYSCTCMLIHLSDLCISPFFTISFNYCNRSPLFAGFGLILKFWIDFAWFWFLVFWWSVFSLVPPLLVFFHRGSPLADPFPFHTHHLHDRIQQCRSCYLLGAGRANHSVVITL